MGARDDKIGPLSFGIDAWAAWLPGRDALLAGGNLPEKAPVPSALRRRISANGKKALEAAWTVLPRQGSAPRLILSSRHGEYERTFRLLREIATSGEVSPADFSLSVHHALIGLLSIATRNTAGHTAIAAGTDSFGFALLEAISCMKEDRTPVLLMHFDESLPPDYDLAEEPTVAMALLLSPEGPYGMSLAPARDGGRDCLASAFAGMLAGGTAVATAKGTSMNWRWTHE